MDEVTTVLGEQFRQFASKICPIYATKELPREAGARQRRTRKADGAPTLKPLVRQPINKVFNLRIYKHHCLGDYADQIRLFGTTDSFTSAIVSTIQTVILLELLLT